MADDKTAAEPSDDDANDVEWAESWSESEAAVRRVAPDRETLEAEAEKALKSHQFRVVKQERGYSVESPVVGYWDAVHAVAEVASGVLGVPAERRTADRETIAQALFTRSLDRLGPGYPTEAITWEVTDQESWRKDADAVLAVLVPADQVRAETMKELSRRYAAEFDYQHGRGESSAPLSGVTWWLIQRGEEYARKAAGA